MKIILIALIIVLLASCQASKTKIVELSQQPNIHKGIFKANKNDLSEVCPELRKGQVLDFKLTSSLPVLFNFHYHQGSETSYPIPEKNITKIEEVFIAPSDNTYCLMWKTHLDNTKVNYQYSIR